MSICYFCFYSPVWNCLHGVPASKCTANVAWVEQNILRDAIRFSNQDGQAVNGRHNLPSLFRIGLTETQDSSWAKTHPAELLMHHCSRYECSILTWNDTLSYSKYVFKFFIFLICWKKCKLCQVSKLRFFCLFDLVRFCNTVSFWIMYSKRLFTWCPSLRTVTWQKPLTQTKV